MDKQREKYGGGSGISSTDRISGKLCRVRDYIYLLGADRQFGKPRHVAFLQGCAAALLITSWHWCDRTS